MSKSSEKRPRKTRASFKVAFLGALAALAYYLWTLLGGGLGFLSHEDDGAAETVQQAPEKLERCVLRVEAEGLSLDGKNASFAEILDACEKRGKATLTATGQANYGQFRRLKEALEEREVELEEHFSE